MNDLFGVMVFCNLQPSNYFVLERREAAGGGPQNLVIGGFVLLRQSAPLQLRPAEPRLQIRQRLRLGRLLPRRHLGVIRI